MSGALGRLLARSAGPVYGVRPRPAARFETAHTAPAVQAATFTLDWPREDDAPAQVVAAPVAARPANGEGGPRPDGAVDRGDAAAPTRRVATTTRRLEDAPESGRALVAPSLPGAPPRDGGIPARPGPAVATSSRRAPTPQACPVPVDRAAARAVREPAEHRPPAARRPGADAAPTPPPAADVTDALAPVRADPPGRALIAGPTPELTTGPQVGRRPTVIEVSIARLDVRTAPPAPAPRERRAADPSSGSDELRAYLRSRARRERR